MKFSINVAEDKELRDAVKELIQGQVKGMIRSGIGEAIDKALNETIPGVQTRIDKHLQTFFNYNLDMRNLRIMVKEQINLMISLTIRDELAKVDFKNLILEEMRKSLKEKGYTTNMESVVRGIVKEQMKNLLG